ncbi:MAG: HAD family phosphatase [Candidatus Dojkabacteria bacterium]|jgi:HAD superfamily hydrolase (TIGR01509 family)|nr:HAD family phosphatase [Candidatus Dojkabacteria bacterium]
MKESRIDISEVKERVLNAKAFLFDFDGTLVNLDKLNVDSFSIVFKEMFGLDFTRDDFMKYISGRGSKNGLIEYLAVHGIKEFSAEEINTMFYKNKKRLIEERLEEEVYLLPGIAEFLKHYGNVERKILVVTSSREEHVERMLTHFKIFQYFEKVIDRSMVVRGKPDPQAFLNGIEYTGFNSNECIAFEDSFYGLQSAKGADLFTVGILNEGWNDDFVYDLADFVVKDYTKLF